MTSCSSIAVVHQIGTNVVTESEEDKALRVAAESHSKNGNEAFSNKDYKNAIHFYTEGIKERCRDVGLQAQLYTNRAAANFNLGNFIDALNDAKMAIDKRPLSLSAILAGASASAKLCQFEQAIAWCNAGTEIDKENAKLLELGKLVAEFAEGENNVPGTTATGNEDLNNLLSELELSEAKEAGDGDGSKGSAYDHLGSLYRSLGDFQKGIEFHQKALKIAKETDDKRVQRRALENLGIAYRALGLFRKAVMFHQQALVAAKGIGNRDSVARAYNNLGVAYVLLGDFKKAIDAHKNALRVAREIGNKHLEELILMNLGIDFYSSRDFTKGEEYLKSTPKLFEKIKDAIRLDDEWDDDIQAKYNKADRFLWRFYLRQGKTMETLLTADRERTQALTKHMVRRYCLDLIRLPQEKHTEGISRLFTRTSTTTIYLTEAAESLNFWVLRKGQQCLFLQKKLSQTLLYLTDRAYEQLAFTKRPPIEDRSMDGPEEDEDLEQLYSIDLKWKQVPQDALKALYDAVITPISHLIEGEEVVIVGDRLSLLIPYAVLEDQHSRYLSQTLRVRLAPSLTSLRRPAYPEGDRGLSSILLVGDPSVKNLYFKDRSFNQLAGAEKEVNAIGRLLNVEPLTGKNATKDRVLSRLQSASLVHFATHSRKGNGEIFLTPNPAKFRPFLETFLLSTEDVLKVRIQAKLVVLSYSNSARGMRTNDQCVLGIAHAFLAAGARCVIGSLWPINDTVTVQLMTQFYENLVDGQSTSQALNNAMAKIRETDNYSAPRFWAPFVVMGDDVTLSFA